MLLDLTQVTRLHGFDPVWLVLAVGAVTFILGFAGCVGALRENICLLKFVSSDPAPAAPPPAGAVSPTRWFYLLSEAGCASTVSRA